MTGSRTGAVILFFVGSVQIGIAVLFLVLARSFPILRTGFGPTSAILGVVGVALWVWGVFWWKGAAAAQRLRREGIPGQAQIVGLRQTGLYVNSQPQVELQLQVTTSMHGAYPVTRKEVVPLIMVGRLTSGQPLPVKVDAANPQNLVIEWESALSPPSAGLGAVPLPAPPSSAAAAEEKERMLRTGVAGTATILQRQALGLFDGDGRPVYDLVLQIEVPGRPPAQGPARVGVPREREHRFKAGERLPIKADPAQPGRMAVDWDRL